MKRRGKSNPKKTKPNKPKEPSRFFCSRCGALEMTFKYMVASKNTRERCTSCGGNLVRRCELPPELNLKIGPNPRSVNQ